MLAGPHPRSLSLGGRPPAGFTPTFALVSREVARRSLAKAGRRSGRRRYNASAPDTTSMISRVIAA